MPITERVKEWKRKKNEALVRKKELLKGKKQKTIEYLNRRARFLEEQEAVQKKLEKEQAIRKARKVLVSISFMMKYTAGIREIIAGKRENIILSLRKSFRPIEFRRRIRKALSSLMEWLQLPWL